MLEKRYILYTKWVCNENLRTSESFIFKERISESYFESLALIKSSSQEVNSLSLKYLKIRWKWSE